MNKQHTKPNGFEHFRIAEIALPCKPWCRLYDVENEIIWINTAAEDANNVVKLEPKKW